jgi:TonB family protein
MSSGEIMNRRIAQVCLGKKTSWLDSPACGAHHAINRPPEGILTMMKELLLIAVFLAPLQGPPQTRSGSVVGRLLTMDGQPAVGIRVSAMAVPDSGIPASTATTLLSFVLTDSSGRYRLENIPAGRYYVTAGLVDLPTYYPGVPALSSATAVNVTAGAAVTGIDFTMAVPAGVTVSGRAILPATPIVTPIRRAALIGGGGPAQETTLGADGSFQFLKVRPGTYTLLLNVGAPTQNVSIAVADKDITGLEIVVPLMVPVTGTLVIEGGGPAPRLSLSFAAYNGGGATVPGTGVVTQGQLRTQLPEGEYRISWSALPAGYSLKSITAGSVDVLANPFKVAAGSPPPPLNVTLGVTLPAPWVKVSGRIVSPRPIQMAPPYQLTLMGTLVDPMNIAANADGSFEFPRVLAGAYTLRLAYPALPTPPTSLMVTNKDLSGIEIAIPAMKEITGRVTVDGLGQITPRLTFAVADPSGAVPVVAVGQPDGTFRVTLPEGDRRITLNVPGYSVKTLSYGNIDVLREPMLRISGTDSAQMQLVLVPSATVTGGVSGGVLGGVVGGIGAGVPGGVLGAILAPAQVNRGVAAPPPPPPPPPSPPQRLGGDVAQANLLSSVAPVYPVEARAARVQDYVMLQATIDKNGNVADLRVIRGHPLLNEAALAAVKQWRYRPQMLNGQPIEVITTITVNFSLQ